MKNFTRNKAQKQAQITIENLKSKGYDIDIAMGGKTIQQIAHNKKTYTEFQKRVKRSRQRPQIQKEVAQYEEKVIERIKKMTPEQQQAIQQRKEKLDAQREKRRQQYAYRNTITPDTKRIAKKSLKWEKITKKALKIQVKKELSFLKDTYFKELRGTPSEKKLDALINKFGTRLDLAHEFMDWIGEQQFKYEFEKDVMKAQMPTKYHEHMKERLDEFISYAENTLKI